MMLFLNNVKVRLRSMTIEEFTSYEEADAHRYAEAMVGAGYWPPVGAFERAQAVHARLLPQGLETPDHFFFVIESTADLKSMGVIWLSIDRTSSPPSGFI